MTMHHAKNLNVHVGYTKINIYWYFHILRLFDVLPNFRFTTSETNGGY